MSDTAAPWRPFTIHRRGEASECPVGEIPPATDEPSGDLEFTPAPVPLLPNEDAIRNLTDAEAEAMWLRLRWSDGKPTCPQCSSQSCYDVTQKPRGTRYRCRGCNKDFTPFSGTPFSYLHVPVRTILIVISAAQRGLGDRSLRRASMDLGLVNYKTFYVLFGKAQEFLSGGPEQRSRFVGYMSQRGQRYAPAAFPRANIDALVGPRTCIQCKAEKPPQRFQRRNGISKDWGLRRDICKDCTTAGQSEKMRVAWAGLKQADAAAPVVERTAEALLAKPRWLGGVQWSTGSWWTNQERHDLEVLARANVDVEAAATALGRSPKSIAWYARDLLSFAEIPRDWKLLIAPPRLIIPAQPRLFVYPYLPSLARNADVTGANLTMQVAKMVNAAFPDFMRADICQTVILAILEGRATVDALRKSPETLRAFVKEYRKNTDALPGGGMRTARNSLDAPRFDDDDRDGHGQLPASIINRLEW